MTVTVYGASDDLIEVEGDIREEFYDFDDDEGGILAFSDGSVVRVKYDSDGCWRCTTLAKGSGTHDLVPAIDAESDNYSDRLTITTDEPMRWVVCGRSWTSARA